MFNRKRNKEDMKVVRNVLRKANAQYAADNLGLVLSIYKWNVRSGAALVKAQCGDIVDYEWVRNDTWMYGTINHLASKVYQANEKYSQKNSPNSID